MYAGRLVETAPASALLGGVRHPYTRGLLAGRPRLEGEVPERLPAIPGRPPDPRDLPDGCRFHPRCEHVVDRCRADVPPLREAGIGHRVACHRFEEIP